LRLLSFYGLSLMPWAFVALLAKFGDAKYTSEGSWRQTAQKMSKAI
jgi:hypothetical protein